MGRGQGWGALAIFKFANAVASAHSPVTEASRVEVFHLSPPGADAEYKHPPPLTPPHHSAREWAEGNLASRGSLTRVERGSP